MQCNIHVICSLSDANILESVKEADFLVIGNAHKTDITVRYCLGPVETEYLIRIKQNKETFEILGVHLTSKRPYIFDCLNLERYLCIPYNAYVWLCNYVIGMHAASCMYDIVCMHMCLCIDLSVYNTYIIIILYIMM